MRLVTERFPVEKGGKSIFSNYQNGQAFPSEFSATTRFHDFFTKVAWVFGKIRYLVLNYRDISFLA